MQNSAKDIDVVMLCGGLGKRLRSAVSDRPKCMAEINGRPFLSILMDYCAGFGFRRFILCTGYKSDYIKQYFKDTQNDLEVIFKEENKPLGTGGAVKNARAIIKSSLFLVMNSDSFCGLDINKFIKFHKTKKAVVSAALTKFQGKSNDYGEIILNNKGQICGFNEKKNLKSGHSLINAGVYIMDKKVFSTMPQRKRFSLEYDFFPSIIDSGFYGYKTNAMFIDIGTPLRYKAACRIFKQRRMKTIFK